MILLHNDAHYIELRDTLETLIPEGIENAKEYIMQAMENGEHTLTTMMHIIKRETEEIMEYLSGYRLRFTKLNEMDLYPSISTYLFNFSMEVARNTCRDEL